jgi:hypothetical protein
VRKERALLEERFMNAKDDTRSQGAALLRKR